MHLYVLLQLKSFCERSCQLFVMLSVYQTYNYACYLLCWLSIFILLTYIKDPRFFVYSNVIVNFSVLLINCLKISCFLTNCINCTSFSAYSYIANLFFVFLMNSISNASINWWSPLMVTGYNMNKMSTLVWYLLPMYSLCTVVQVINDRRRPPLINNCLHWIRFVRKLPVLLFLT